MHRFPLSFALYLIIFASFISCSKEESSPILLFVNPSNQYSTSAPGEYIRINVVVQSKTDLNKIRITQQIDNNSIQVLLDSTISGTNLNLPFSIQAPFVSDSSKLLLLFSVTDKANNQMSLPMIVIVKNPGNLIETTGLSIYSHTSGKQDAFVLSQKLPLYSSLSDSSVVDIVDATKDSTMPNTLSGKWLSFTGVNFVRFNDFDYANANYKYLSEVFEAGIKSPFIDNLQSDDIILLKTKNGKYYAIRMVYVIDADQSSDDRYIFNLKELKNP